jgi:hypothetical protein
MALPRRCAASLGLAEGILLIRWSTTALKAVKHLEKMLVCSPGKS